MQITLTFANSEAKNIEASLRQKYSQDENVSVEALCEKAVLTEAFPPNRASKSDREKACGFCGLPKYMCSHL